MRPTRRQALAWLGAAVAARCLPAQASLTADDDDFLDDLERRGCRFFVEQAGPISGQVLDRARADNADGKRDPRSMASIAGTGFGLSALCIAHNRSYANRAAIRDQVLHTLRFHADVLPNVHGFFFHFTDVDTGARWRDTELSSIDTSILLCGVLTARAYFHTDFEIVSLATTIYERVDWPWMLNGADVFSMGWKPGSGFLKSTWNHYCELMMIPLLALGSPTHPVDPRVWSAWSRPEVTYADLTYISGRDPLFTHQYSHAWFDFRQKRDAFADYFANSVLATRAHKAFCLSLGKPYSETYWGISASDSAEGYQAWGGPPSLGHLDGSVVPYATAGSLPFLPADCLRVQRALKANFGDRCYGRYGFSDALHPAANWYDADVLGIDLGITVLMAENLRTNFIWRTFSRNPEVAIAMQRAGFRTV